MVQVAHRRWCSSLEIAWLIGDGVAHWKLRGLLEMAWLIRDSVAHWKLRGSLEMEMAWLTEKLVTGTVIETSCVVSVGLYFNNSYLI